MKKCVRFFNTNSLLGCKIFVSLKTCILRDISRYSNCHSSNYQLQLELLKQQVKLCEGKLTVQCVSQIVKVWLVPAKKKSFLLSCHMLFCGGQVLNMRKSRCVLFVYTFTLSLLFQLCKLQFWFTTDYNCYNHSLTRYKFWFIPAILLFLQMKHDIITNLRGWRFIVRFS